MAGPLPPTHFSKPQRDVRAVMSAERQKVLAGCHLVFSRVIPLEQVPSQHSLWQMAEQFGAVCSTCCSPATTHVVANSQGTDKVGWRGAAGLPGFSVQWGTGWR